MRLPKIQRVFPHDRRKQPEFQIRSFHPPQACEAGDKHKAWGVSPGNDLWRATAKATVKLKTLIAKPMSLSPACAGSISFRPLVPGADAPGFMLLPASQAAIVS